QIVIRVLHTLLTGLNDQRSILTMSVLWLIPLGFLVPDEPTLVSPVLRIRRTISVELIGPDKLVALMRSRLVSSTRGRRQDRNKGSYGYRNVAHLHDSL